MANCLGANFVGAIDLALVTSLRRLDASTCRVYRLRAEVVRHGWMGYGGTVPWVQYPEIAGNYDRVVSRVLWSSYGGGVGSSLATGNHRYGPVYIYIGMSHQMVRPCQPAGHRRPGGVAVAR